MEFQLYPLKFYPIYKETIWGGTRLQQLLNKNPQSDHCGESWEISCVKDNISVVKEGFLKDNNLQELIEVYMGDLVGDRIYEIFGNDFPLLIKFIDANDKLSIQVHPNDATAAKRHGTLGKTEMWYVMQAEKNAQLIIGFEKDITKETYLQHLQNKTLESILHYEKVKEGDIFFIPAGRVHAIGAGILLTEIQQTSDITYRIYDYDRKDKNGKSRELHTDLAIDVIDYKKPTTFKTPYTIVNNRTMPAVECDYFVTNIIACTERIEKDYFSIESFVIHICTEGKYVLQYDENTLPIEKGECVLIPAMINTISIVPERKSRILEVYINPK